MSTIDIRNEGKSLINEIIFSDGCYVSHSVRMVEDGYFCIVDSEDRDVFIKKEDFKNLINAIKKAEELWT